MDLLQPTEEVSIQEAIAACNRYVGYCSRSTVYRWMRALKIAPTDGYITRWNLARLCVWGKALAKIGNVRAAARTMKRVQSELSEQEFIEFAFNPRSSFVSTITEDLNHVSA